MLMVTTTNTGRITRRHPVCAEEQFINDVKVDLYNNLRWMISSKTVEALY